MILLEGFFRLPIYRYPEKIYYKKESMFYEKSLKDLRHKNKGHWDQYWRNLSKNEKLRWKILWSWPRWHINNIIGYIIIGYDGGDCIVGDIWLKRKYLPRDYKDKIQYRLHSNLQDTEVSPNHVMHYCNEIDKIKTDIKQNFAIISTIDTLLKNGISWLNQLNSNFFVDTELLKYRYMDFTKIIKSDYRN